MLRAEALRPGLEKMAHSGRIRDPLAHKRALRVLHRFDEDPRIAQVAAFFEWRPSDIYRFSEKLGGSLLQKLSDFSAALDTLPLLKVGNLSLSGEKLENVFLYDLQAPGEAENYLLLSKFGLLKAIGKGFGVDQHVGLSGQSLSAHNKEFRSASQEDVRAAINRREGIIEKLGFRAIEYEMPEDIDEILERVKQDKQLSKLIDGEAAQVFGWKSFKEDQSNRELARKYFVSQIVEMLRYCNERSGAICVHFGPESEKAWDKVLAVILREKKEEIFGFKSMDCGFFSVHYARPRIDGKLILPYSPSELDSVPLLSDSREELEKKLSGLSILEREQLLIGLRLLESQFPIAIYGEVQPESLAKEMIEIADRLGVRDEI